MKFQRTTIKKISCPWPVPVVVCVFCDLKCVTIQSSLVDVVEIN